MADEGVERGRNRCGGAVATRAGPARATLGDDHVRGIRGARAEPIIEQVYAALKSEDLTIEEMLEVVLHFAVYCGWPKASNLEMYVRQAWARVQEERGEDPQPLPMLEQRRARA